MASCNQGEELPNDRIGRGRSTQAVLEMTQGGRPILPLDGDRAQVEEHERRTICVREQSCRVAPAIGPQGRPGTIILLKKELTPIIASVPIILTPIIASVPIILIARDKPLTLDRSVSSSCSCTGFKLG